MSKSRYSKKHGAYRLGAKKRPSGSRAYVRYYVVNYDPKTRKLGSYSTLRRDDAARARKDYLDAGLHVGMFTLAENADISEEEFQRKKWKAVGVEPPKASRRPWWRFW